MKSIPVTVPMRYIRSMVDALAERGTPREEALAWAGGGLNAAMLEASRARVSLQQFSRLYSAAVRRLEDEGAGLSGYRIPPGAVETLSRAGTTARSFLECAEILAKSLNASIHGPRFSFSSDPHGIHIVLHEHQPLAEQRIFTYEVVLLTAYATMGWLFGRRLPLVSVDFPCAAPRHLFELRTLFSGAIRFNQPTGALRFHLEHAALRVIRTPADLPKFLRRMPGSLVEALITRGELTVEVRRHLHASLPRLLTLNEVAQRLAQSPRSLHRKLDAEGASFQEIKDALRHDLAINALTRTDTPLKQIAIDVGFLDQASFQRAFAQWTGRPPGAWRRNS